MRWLVFARAPRLFVRSGHWRDCDAPVVLGQLLLFGRLLASAGRASEDLTGLLLIVVPQLLLELYHEGHVLSVLQQSVSEVDLAVPDVSVATGHSR